MSRNHTLYTVAPKDCLWDLADRFYGKPTLWPMIFEYNNLPHIIEATGTRILDPDLILIGQNLMIPKIELAERYGSHGLDQVKRNVSQARQEHKDKGAAQQQHIRRIQQDQPQPKNGEAMARGRAKYIARPAYEIDLGNTTLAATKGPGFSLSAKLSGKLLLQDTRPSHIDISVNGINNLKASSKHQTETAAGKLISDLKFDVDLKNRSVKLSGGLAAQSNIKGAPLVKMEAGVNNLGQPILKGSVTYDVVKGKLPHYTVLGEKVTFVIEIAADMNKVEQEAGKIGSIWDDLGKTVSGVVLGVASIALVVATLYEDIVTVGVGTWNDAASIALASAMIITARKLIVRHGSRAARQALRWLVITATGIMVAPITVAKATGLLEDKK